MTGDLPATVLENDKGDPILAPEPFKSAGEVREYAGAMISADNLRATWRAEIDGLINGNQPLDPAALKAKKMSWYPNVPYRQAEGFLQAAQTAFYDLVTEASPCIEVYLDYGKGEEKVNWEESIAQNWTWLMFHRDRLETNYNFQMSQREMLVHGLGCHVWPQMNTANWHERTPATGHVLFPEDSPLNFQEEGEAFMLRDFIPMHRLYGFIKNEKAATALGWQVENTWKTMAQASRNSRLSSDNIEAFTRQMKRGDAGSSISRQAGIWVDWVFAREIGTSKVSLYAIPESSDVGGHYLFKKRNLYDRFPLAIFPYDIGTGGKLHATRGLGARTKDFFKLSDRIKNSMAAQVILGSTVLLQQTGTMDPAKMKLLKMGMMSILPQNLQIAQGFRFPDLSQGPLALDQNLNDTLRGNTQAYSSGAPEAKDRETALSYQMRSQDSSQVSKGAHGLYGSHLCNYWNIKFPMVLKAAKMTGDRPYIKLAKEFVQRCKRDGVPDEAFEHVAELREVMSTGAGSASVRIQSYMALIASPVYANTSEDRRVNIERDLTAALFDGSRVNRYARSLNDGDMTDDDDSLIALENDAMTRGGQAVVAPRQDQVKHIQGHLQAAGELVQALQQGDGDPRQVLVALHSYGSHIAAHLQQIEGNKTKEDDYKALKKELDALGSVADQLQSKIEDEMSEVPPEQQLSEKAQLDLMKAKSQEQVRNVKAAGHEQRAWRNQQFQERIADVKTAAEIQRQKQKQLATAK